MMIRALAVSIRAVSICVALAGAGPAAAADKTVQIDNFTFKPAELEVSLGAKVTIKNEDDIPHSVVAADGSFHSQALDTKDEYSFTPTKVGTIAYYCGLHPFMKGTIKVVP